MQCLLEILISHFDLPPLLTNVSAGSGRSWQAANFPWFQDSTCFTWVIYSWIFNIRIWMNELHKKYMVLVGAKISKENVSQVGEKFHRTTAGGSRFLAIPYELAWLLTYSFTLKRSSQSFRLNTISYILPHNWTTNSTSHLQVLENRSNSELISKWPFPSPTN